MQHYQIIYDPVQVLDFLRKFIPDDETLSISFKIFARRKYNSALPDSEYILNRTFIPGGTSAESAMRKLWRQHVPVGSYVDKNDVAIPPDSMCAYAVLKPKNPLRALSSTMKQCMDDVCEGKRTRNPYGLLNTIMAKPESDAIGGPKYTQIDLDTKDPEHIRVTCEVLDSTGVSDAIVSITETHGGYHIVYIKSKTIDSHRLHEFKLTTVFEKTSNDGKIVKDYWFSQTNQPLVVIPGTIQGGFKATNRTFSDLRTL